ncbi:MAG: hypothetical protein JWO67_7186 [Streptosporangiaceae bacterium]|nr:hypothetical protein [Streptosporangiaceae bacterium]
MRVVATSAFKTYYGMVPVEVAEGDEFEGEFADFLLAGGSAVEEVHDPGDALDSASARGEAAQQGLVEARADARQRLEAMSEDLAEVPADGTIDAVLAWVDGDAGRAAVAREAEQGKDKPRTTLLKRLDEITGS